MRRRHHHTLVLFSIALLLSLLSLWVGIYYISSVLPGGGGGDIVDERSFSPLCQHDNDNITSSLGKEVVLLTKNQNRNSTHTHYAKFPYELTCKKSDLSSFLQKNNLIDCNSKREGAKSNNNITIAIAYHVGMIQNWRTIVSDQMATLSQCGLPNFHMN